MNTRSRRPPRRAVPLRCQAVRERGFRLLGDAAIDISASGMMLRARTPVLTGETVIVSFFEPTESRWYDTEATVARVMHGRRATDRGRCVGLRFDSLDERERGQLAAAIERGYWGTSSVDDTCADAEGRGESVREVGAHAFEAFDATQ